MADETFLLDNREVVLTSHLQVQCDGDGVLGHPLEFMSLAKAGEVLCKYCGRRFVYAASPTAEDVRARGQRLAPASAAGCER